LPAPGVTVPILGYNKGMPALAAAVVAAFVLSVAAVSAAPAPNVKGVVVRSRSVTACFPGEPCDPPPQATFVIFTRNGHTTRVTIGATGAFTARLVPGLYAVSLAPMRSGVSPATVRVPRIGVIRPRFVQR
jgi:hypothetical protein